MLPSATFKAAQGLCKLGSASLEAGGTETVVLGREAQRDQSRVKSVEGWRFGTLTGLRNKIIRQPSDVYETYPDSTNPDTNKDLTGPLCAASCPKVLWQ